MILIILFILIGLFTLYSTGGEENAEKNLILHVARFKHPFAKIDYAKLGKMFGFRPEQVRSIIKLWSVQQSIKPIYTDHVPPLVELRRLFKKTYSDFRFFKTPLRPADQKKLEKALKQDIYTLDDNAAISKAAEDFEDTIGQLLDKAGIRYKTQSQLTQEQIKERGYAYCTPDFVIEGPYTWIDAKNYYAPFLPFIYSKINQQAEKYEQKFGRGLMVFKWGCNPKYHRNKTEFIEISEMLAHLGF